MSVEFLHSHDLLQVAEFFLEAGSRKLLLAIKSNGKRTDGHLRGPEVKEICVDQRDIKQEAGIEKHSWLMDLNCAGIILQEGLRWRAVDLKFDGFKHFALESAHLSGLERVLGHLDEV